MSRQPIATAGSLAAVGEAGDRGDTRWWVWHAAVPTAAFLLLMLACDGLGVVHGPGDLWLADHFYDPAAGRWTYGDSWWANEGIHLIGKYVVVTFGVICLGGLALARWGESLAGHGRVFGFIVLSLVLGTGLVAMLKKTTNVDCPWDFQCYGGTRPELRLLEPRPADLPRGRCFPGGHSSGAFSLLSLYFVAREHRRRWAVAVVVAVLALGLVFALGQWARGAHLASHDVASAYLCWMVALLLYRFAFRGRLASWSSGPPESRSWSSHSSSSVPWQRVRRPS